jgi:hypothetical protein
MTTVAGHRRVASASTAHVTAEVRRRVSDHARMPREHSHNLGRQPTVLSRMGTQSACAPGRQLLFSAFDLGEKQHALHGVLYGGTRW